MTQKKVILVGLIVIMLESIAGYIYLTYPGKMAVLDGSIQPSPQASIKPQTLQKATLALRTDQVNIKKGQQITVQAILETNGNKLSAADLTISYDPTALTLVATNSAKPFQDSPIFQKTVFNSLDAKSGLATMSAVSEDDQILENQFLLTSMAFKALKVGPTEITIVFTPGETRDTNIVSETKDILGSVQNLSFNISP